MASEEAPFLLLKERTVDPDNTYLATCSGQFCWHLSWSKALLAHLGIVAIYTVASIFVIGSQRYTTVLPPAAFDNLHITYSPTLFHRLNATTSAGSRPPEIDVAWDALLAPMHITVSKADLECDNQDSVARPESGGYLGWMGVFHELHCIVNSLLVYLG